MINKHAFRVPVVLALFVLVAASCSGSQDEPTSQGYVFEPSNEPGPDAFTPSVAIEDQSTENSQGRVVPAAQAPVCDKELLKQELEARPDAKKAWAEVEGIPEDEVSDYIDSLVPQRLSEATNVTNHGLTDGKTPYARLATLEAGTAVLYRPDSVQSNSLVVPASFSRSGVRAQSPTEDPDGDGADPTPSPTGSYYPGADDTPVTRCKCGNPLLPPTYPQGTPSPGYWESPSPTPSFSPTPTPSFSPTPSPSFSPDAGPTPDDGPTPDGGGNNIPEGQIPVPDPTSQQNDGSG